MSNTTIAEAALTLDDVCAGAHVTDLASGAVGWIIERVAEGIVTVARYAGGRREARFERWRGIADFAARYGRTTDEQWESYLETSNAWGRATAR